MGQQQQNKKNVDYFKLGSDGSMLRLIRLIKEYIRNYTLWEFILDSNKHWSHNFNGEKTIFFFFFFFRFFFFL